MTTYWTLTRVLFEYNRAVEELYVHTQCRYEFKDLMATARNSSYGKVLFSQACVIPDVHRGGGFASKGVLIQGESASRGTAFGGLHRGGLHPGGLHRGIGQIPPILWDTVNERAAHILPECILAYTCNDFYVDLCSLYVSDLSNSIQKRIWWRSKTVQQTGGLYLMSCRKYVNISEPSEEK